MSGATEPADVRDGGETVDSFAEIGVTAFTTGRSAGSFGTQSDEPVSAVMGRWRAVRGIVGGAAVRLATAVQVHGARVLEHDGEWRGWLRGDDADGHLSLRAGTAMAVTVADCVPVFLAHPVGATAALHSGWRGTEAGITEAAVASFIRLGLRPRELRLHCGPSICGRCYEVSAEVYGRLTGRRTERPTAPVDLRALIAHRARELGVGTISVSDLCTRCNNDRFFSHRAGDAGRQVGVIVARR